ncbi:MAG: diacylglycerol kinase [Gammaproteobacteria bacterium]|nr:diacylglycerol kinase [Gammaproteobacteria bacterium]
MGNVPDEAIDAPRSRVNQRRGLSRLIAATGYSLSGLNAAWRSEEAFRQEAVLALIMLPGAFWLGTTLLERLLLACSVLLVLIVELLNTAIEYTVDRIGTDHHELSGRAKDMGSAAVMLSLVLAAMIWVSIAWARFFGAG